MPDKGALERLEKKLDDRTDPPRVRRSGFFGMQSASAAGWASAPQKPAKPGRRGRRLRAIEIAFIGSLAFFILAAAVSAFLFFSGTNTVSTRNVAIAVSGPTSIRAGDTVSLQIVVTNKNSVPMQLTDLVVAFPDGTRSAADVSVALPRLRETLGDIAPGETVNKTISARIFGTAGATADVDVSVEYRVPSSNAIFQSQASYSAPISESPASITVQGLTQVISGQATSITVTVASNVTEVLSGMVLTATYPPGFSFTASSPSPTSGSASWNLGDIEPGGKRTVTINGTFTGDDGDTRVIHFTTGAASDTNPAAVSAPLATADTDFMIAKPFITASLALDGDTSATHIIRRGQPVRVDVAWQNNLPTNVQDLEIDVSLNGTILDRTSVAPVKGFFRSADNTVIFSPENDPSLADVPPGTSGVASFSFSSVPPGSGVFKNPEVDLAVTVTAHHLTDANSPQTVTSSASASAVVATDIGLQSGLSRGVFADTGLVPPKADQETLYTVTWVLQNSSNAAANASVSATLPSYVRFTNVVTPGQTVTYNPVGGIVTWTIGDLAESAAQSVSFQIGITPSINQVGVAPTVVSDQRASALDRFTGTQVSATALPLTTSSGTTLQQGNVVP